MHEFDCHSPTASFGSCLTLSRSVLNWRQSNMTGFLTPKENRDLIEKVRERNLLWDPTHVDYKRRTIRDNTWTDIAKTLNQPAELMRNSWNRIRNSHSREYRFSKKFRRRSSWRYYRNLAFLREGSRLRRPKRESAQRHTGSQTSLSESILYFRKNYPAWWARKESLRGISSRDLIPRPSFYRRNSFLPVTKTENQGSSGFGSNWFNHREVVEMSKNLKRGQSTLETHSNYSQDTVSRNTRSASSVHRPFFFELASGNPSENNNHPTVNEALDFFPYENPPKARTLSCRSTRHVDKNAVEDHRWIDARRPYTCPGSLFLNCTSLRPTTCSTSNLSVDRQTSLRSGTDSVLEPGVDSSGQRSYRRLQTPIRLRENVRRKVIDSSSEFFLRRSGEKNSMKTDHQASSSGFKADSENFHRRLRSWQSVSATNVEAMPKEATSKFTRKKSTRTVLRTNSRSPLTKRLTAENTSSKSDWLNEKRRILYFCHTHFSEDSKSTGLKQKLPNFEETLNFQTSNTTVEDFSSRMKTIIELVCFLKQKLLVLFSSNQYNSETLEFLKSAGFKKTVCCMNADFQDGKFPGLSRQARLEIFSNFTENLYANALNPPNASISRDESHVNQSHLVNRVNCEKDTTTQENANYSQTFSEVDPNVEENDEIIFLYGPELPEVEILEVRKPVGLRMNSDSEVMHLDEDYHFLMSLYQQMTYLPRHKRIGMRIKMQAMMFDQLY